MSERLESILDYYREKADQLEGERDEWLQQLSVVKQHVERVQGDEVIVGEKKEKIVELQKALSETHISIFDDKRHLMDLQKENGVLEKQHNEDCRKIEELLALTEDVNKLDSKIHFKDCRHESEEVDGSVAISQSQKQRMQQKKNYIEKFEKIKKAAKKKHAGVIKTVFLPHEDVNRLRQEIEKAKAYKQL